MCLHLDRRLLTSAIWLLLKHPDQLQQLRDEPSLITATIEEFLRYESPFQRLGRVARENVSICGQSINHGETVLCLLGAANRDPQQFPEPNRFDIHRCLNRHVAFGHGIHFCIGAALARLEAPIAINRILGRFPRLALGCETVEWSMGVLRAIKTLPVRF